MLEFGSIPEKNVKDHENLLHFVKVKNHWNFIEIGYKITLDHRFTIINKPTIFVLFSWNFVKLLAYVA